MKIFTVDEANEMLPVVRPKLERLKKLYTRISLLSDQAKAAASASEAGGGMPGGALYVKALYEIGRIMTEIAEDGIQLKDYDRGLIDFPCFRDGRVVLLCWQLGEREEIEWWHETEAGFAGRQRL
jgi:hypothetical protein